VGEGRPTAKMWIVPLSEDTHKNSPEGLKAKLWISARSAPRRSSWRRLPDEVSYTRTIVPLSEAVANNVPL